MQRGRTLQPRVNGSFVPWDFLTTISDSSCRNPCRQCRSDRERLSQWRPTPSGAASTCRSRVIEADTIAKSYGLTNATRFINLLEVAGVSRTQRDASGAQGTGGGGEIDFQIPIFDFGEARLREVGETYMQAINRLTEKAVNVRSEAREAYQAYRSRYDIAEHFRRDVLPLRKTISDETMLRYGAMQIDVFALLSEARQRIAANIAAIEAQRDFWLADCGLDAAISGGGDDNGDRAPAATGSAEPKYNG